MQLNLDIGFCLRIIEILYQTDILNIRAVFSPAIHEDGFGCKIKSKYYYLFFIVLWLKF